MLVGRKENSLFPANFLYYVRYIEIVVRQKEAVGK